MTEVNQITASIIQECSYIHQTLGTGLLEPVYKEMLYQQLMRRNLFVQQHVAVSAFYKELKTEVHFKADFVVENAVICTIKKVNKLQPAHKKQLKTYIRLANKRLGLLINFGEPYFEDGIITVVNHHYEQLC